MRVVRLVAEARREFLDAVARYEQQRPSLGVDFSAAIARALRVIEEHPETWPLIGRAGLRRYVLRRFPYTVIYGLHEGLIIVVAFAHAKRKPGYWRARLPTTKRRRRPR